MSLLNTGFTPSLNTKNNFIATASDNKASRGMYGNNQHTGGVAASVLTFRICPNIKADAVICSGIFQTTS
jgi:hypothetical protein